ncbi:MAG: fumarylacetoacetate hydrolase family protein [Halothermotrichaceae bacterium]
MKIVRYEKENKIKYGQLEEDLIKVIKGDIFAEFEVVEETIERDEVNILPPVDPPNVIAIGLNYKKHAAETGSQLPERPLIFIKANTSVIGHNDIIVLPHMAPDEVDYEAELAIIIGKKAKNIEKDEVDNYILGYTCVNDVSARDCQKRLDKQWARGKSFDTFCPVGPCIETDIIPDNCNIKSRLNGKIMQSSNTNDLIFETRELVSYISKNMTLLPGTIISTGTPEGVGVARKPPVFLKPGDTIEIEVEGIGILKNEVTSEDF